jgi:lipopolysaccharide/colanic/teichoic acid biosynthesis glycosyltransferase
MDHIKRNAVDNFLAYLVCDLVIPFALIALTLPIMIIVAIGIRCDSPGPIFYRQERVGLGGRRFSLVKFRSMIRDAEPEGRPVWAAQKDNRVTRVGRLIRRMRIDELPQLFNVLRGEMRLVGPRPERPYFVDQLDEIIPFFAERHSVKPGITGWAQINYPYGSSIDDARKKHAYDMYYLRNRNIVLDLLILFLTVRVVILQQGAR